ncbi:hypothetical protein [Prosthecobacter sp.]|uniref:hypothetical protein n=1 Tax=Prosthecobacter sp. TaxID=1965333 RepID=UPI00378436EB
MSDTFLRCLFPGQARVCGRLLPPLTLWRLACLEAIQSPFLHAGAEDASFTLADLLCAVRAVSTPNLTPPDLRASVRDAITLLRFRHNAAYREKHAAIFIEWLALHQLRPELWKNDDEDSRDISAPITLSYAVGLMSIGFRHAEAWDTPPGYASWVLSASAERQSDRVKFASDDDDEINRIIEAEEQRSEAEILAQAKLDLSEEAYERWVAARASRHQKGT